MKNIFYRISILLLSLIFTMLTALPAFAVGEQSTKYYIDSISGSDDNDGTSPEGPWRTLERASDNSYGPGDEILLKAGQSYEASFITSGSGSEDMPVTVTSYGEGDRPLIYAENMNILFMVVNVSNWVIDGIDFSAPEGTGLNIIAYNGGNVENIAVRNCTFRNISPDNDSTVMAALTINCDSSASVVRNIHLDSLKFFDVGWAIHTNGKNAEDDKNIFLGPDESYNSDYLFENIYIENAKCGGIVISSVKNCLVRNCRLLNCACADGFDPYAPLWMRHSTNVTVEYCEIAGAANSRDGMAVDFDGWTTNSTYRYIYSHDNNRFIRNCVYDSGTKNSGNSVYCCVSVDDNKSINHAASPLFSTRNPSFSLMHDFSFHDNIIVNGSPIIWLGTPFADVHDLTFIGTPFNNFINRIFNFFLFSKTISYKKGTAADAAEMINEITKNLPTAE